MSDQEFKQIVCNSSFNYSRCINKCLLININNYNNLNLFLQLYTKNSRNEKLIYHQYIILYFANEEKIYDDIIDTKDCIF